MNMNMDIDIDMDVDLDLDLNLNSNESWMQSQSQIHERQTQNQALFTADLCQILISYLYVEEQEIDCFLAWLVRLPQLCMEINSNITYNKHKKSVSSKSKSTTISYEVDQSIRSYNISSMMSSDSRLSTMINHRKMTNFSSNSNPYSSLFANINFNLNMIPMQYALEYAIMDRFVRDDCWKHRQRIHKYFDNRKWIFRILMNQNFMNYAMKYDKEWLMIALNKVIKFVGDSSSSAHTNNHNHNRGNNNKEHSYSNKMSVSDVIHFTKTNFLNADKENCINIQNHNNPNNYNNNNTPDTVTAATVSHNIMSDV
jgi:hypothetical protein